MGPFLDYQYLPKIKLVLHNLKRLGRINLDQLVDVPLELERGE
jgi:hypothetical protein